jgi:hypothetical protein
MDFDAAELAAIERACRAQASSDRERASKMDRPVLRNQANDAAEELARIICKIERERRTRSGAAGGCRTCDD